MPVPAWLVRQRAFRLAVPRPEPSRAYSSRGRAASVSSAHNWRDTSPAPPPGIPRTGSGDCSMCLPSRAVSCPAPLLTHLTRELPYFLHRRALSRMCLFRRGNRGAWYFNRLGCGCDAAGEPPRNQRVLAMATFDVERTADEAFPEVRRHRAPPCANAVRPCGRL